MLLAGERPRGGGFGWDFALALGYSSLAMFGVQFWLTARFKRATAPFGIDIIYYFHRYLAVVALLLLFAHVAIVVLRYPDATGPFDPREAPGYMTLGRLALIAFVLLIASSLWRKALRIEYDRWRRWHVLLAVLGIAFSVLHALGSAAYLTSPGKRALWTALAASWLLLVLWVRLARPALLQRHPWRIAEVRREPGRAWTVALEPRDPPGFDYRPGQFAWLSVRSSPFALREHPFSIASSPTRPGRLEFMIKELGDFTATVGQWRSGETVWVDGPYGSFGVDRLADAPGFVFIAGGAGIAPVISMLRALADRGERRPLWLFYGNRRIERAVYADELQALAGRLDLRLVHVLTEPPPDWSGESGYVDHDVLARHLPQQRSELQYFICGPDPMIRLAEQSLERLGVPLRRLHSEIFDLA